MDASKPRTAVAAAGFRRKEYQRIREIAHEMPPTGRTIEGIKAKGMVCRKMLVDPDYLRAFARTAAPGWIPRRAVSSPSFF
jgi:hypothetical protein